MEHVGVWQITEEGPRKLAFSTIDLEQHLEDWIARDPSLLENGLRVVGRQVNTAAGCLDLLALDPQDRWVIIELKRGALYRDALAQALDYAACLASMPDEQLSDIISQYASRLRSEGRTAPEGVSPMGDSEDSGSGPRDIRIFVVGVGRDPGLDRVAGFLSDRYQVPVTVVSFDVHELPDAQRLLVRQLTGAETEPAEGPAERWPTVDELSHRAEQAGIGNEFRAIVEAATRNELYPRPFRKSVILTPPANHARSLFTIWIEPTADGEMLLWLGPEAFAKFYPVSEDEVVSKLGEGEYRTLTPVAVKRFVAGLDRLFKQIREKQAIAHDAEDRSV